MCVIPGRSLSRVRLVLGRAFASGRVCRALREFKGRPPAPEGVRAPLHAALQTAAPPRRGGRVQGFNGESPMSEFMAPLDALPPAEPATAAQLLPAVYHDLRRLAAAKLAHEPPGQTLEPTALVHEAFLRLTRDTTADHWDSRGHFFAAAAEAMRRILVENARRKRALKNGGGLARHPLEEAELLAPQPREDLLALDEALTQLAAADPAAAQLVQLRYFGGLSIPDAARVLGISPRSADRLWAYARAWLHARVQAARRTRDPP